MALIRNRTTNVYDFLSSQTLLTPAMLNNHRGLLDLIFQFLEHMVWEKEKSQLARKVSNELKLMGEGGGGVTIKKWEVIHGPRIFSN